VTVRYKGHLLAWRRAMLCGWPCWRYEVRCDGRLVFEGDHTGRYEDAVRYAKWTIDQRLAMREQQGVN
jgi:hypothetical protein